MLTLENFKTDVNDDIKRLLKQFQQIKDMNWVKSKRKGTTGIGYTFECLLNKEEENLEIPDFGAIEIKAKNFYSRGKIELFVATPDGDSLFAIQSLRERFGYPDKDMPKYKIFNGNVNGKNFSPIGSRYFFKLLVNREMKKVSLLILDRDYRVADNSISWSFDLIKEKLLRKLKYLAVVNAYQKSMNQELYYKYEKIDIYQLISFDKFIDLIEEGIIEVTFTIGVFKSGKRTGQVHDHGTEFVIYEKNLPKLFFKIA